ncbi:MAG: hypothetical protein E2O96_04525 [Acidobacteria bacterium]|nr:MAG: hypothetical protein E2O96_04525 [Acidobacteriota bacterium]
MHQPFQGGGGSPGGGPGVDHPAGVGDRPPPFRLLLFGGDLSGDVGDNRSELGQFAWILGESGECFEVDSDVDGG